MTTVYVARYLGVDTDVLPSGTAVGLIVGGNTALDTRDGDTSYVRVSRNWAPELGSGNGAQMPFRWEKLSGPTPNPDTVTAITVDTEYRTDDDDATGASAFAIGSYVEGVGLNLGQWLSGSAVDWTYEGGRSVALHFAGNVITGEPFTIFSLVAPLFTANLTRITYLRLTMEAGIPPLRQRNRGRVRARLRADRQRSIRQRGFL